MTNYVRIGCAVVCHVQCSIFGRVVRCGSDSTDRQLPSFFIEKSGDHIVEHELVQGCGIEVDNNWVISGWETHCKGQDSVKFIDQSS